MNDYLLSLQDLQNHLFKQGYNAPGGVDTDANLQLLRSMALDRIERFLDYKCTSQTITDEYYSGIGGPYIYVNARPITSLTSVTIDDDSYDTSLFIAHDDYIEYKDGYFPRGYNNVKLTYVAGYTRATMPGIIRHTALRLCSYYYQKQNRETVQSESDAQGNSKSFIETESQILEEIRSYQRG